MAKNFLITGIGGQGVVTLGKLIVESAKKYEKSVTLYPIKGMAQRGGVITTYVRVGEYVSPLIPQKEADITIALEMSESLRYISTMKEGGILLCNKRIFVPQSMKLKDYPKLEEIEKYYKQLKASIVLFDADEIKKDNPSKVIYENIALLGVLSSLLTKEKYLEPDKMKSLISSYFKYRVTENLYSFDIGYDFGRKIQMSMR